MPFAMPGPGMNALASLDRALARGHDDGAVSSIAGAIEALGYPDLAAVPDDALRAAFATVVAALNGAEAAA